MVDMHCSVSTPFGVGIASEKESDSIRDGPIHSEALPERQQQPCFN
jgi:hypothetical protein